MSHYGGITYHDGDRPPPSHRQNHGSDVRPNDLFPPVNSINRGKVTRIEQYGAFVAIPGFRLSALVHITQLAKMRVEKVEDVVSLNEDIYVKIVGIEETETTRDDGKPMTKRKIKGSIKYCDQSDGTDLDPDGREVAEEEQRREARLAGGDGGGTYKGPDKTGSGTELGMKLNSTMGLGVALDPMVAMAQMSNSFGKRRQLVLSGGAGPPQSDNAAFGGYDLVGDDEGEPEPPASVREEPVKPIAPVGRGRGSTIPSWMTNPQQHEPEKRSKKEKNEKKIHKSHKKSSKHNKHKKEKKKTKKKKKKKRKEEASSSESGSGTDSDSDSDSDSDGGQFESKEEAERLIEMLEEKKRKKRGSSS